MELKFETLRVEWEDPKIAVVIMDRPQARNAMNTQMVRDLRDCFNAFYIEQNAANCIILTGEGDKAFSAGADLKERKGISNEEFARQHALGEQTVRAVMTCPIPIIAAVNGAAFGGGCEFALACDFIYAAERARFAQTEVRLGIIPGAGGTQNMPRAVGARRAKEIVLSGETFTAADGLAWGMINKVVPDAELREAALAAARKIAANAPIAVRQAKKSLDKATELDRSTGYAFEIEAYYRSANSDDRQEGINAYNEKRKPDFKGH